MITATPKRSDTLVLEREVRRFVDSTTKSGGPQLYRNRRTAHRFHRSLPLFVKRLDGSLIEDTQVTLANVSTGGVGFYCDDGFPIGAVLSIKLFWSDPHAPRVPAVVRHVEITQQGVLIGAEFILNDDHTCKRAIEQSTGWYG